MCPSSRTNNGVYPVRHITEIDIKELCPLAIVGILFGFQDGHYPERFVPRDSDFNRVVIKWDVADGLRLVL